jgi:hypothetical protein
MCWVGGFFTYTTHTMIGTRMMMKQVGMKFLLLGVLLGTSGCQLFYDGRDESLMVVSAADWSELHQFKKDERARQIEAARPTPLEGAEKISFLNMSDAYLAGCRSLGVVEVHHQGPYDEAMILMRNQAVELAASAIVPLDVYRDKNMSGGKGPQLTFLKGRMVRCPQSAEEKKV